MDLKPASARANERAAIWHFLFLVTALVLGLMFGGGDVAAHAAIERSEPAAGAVVPEPPAEIRIWFTEPLERTYTGAELLDASGIAVAGVTAAIAPDNAHQLVITPPPDLLSGSYTVAWRTLSAADGHTLEGYFGFQIGTGGSGPPIAESTSGAGNDIARPLTRGLALLGLAALLAIAPLTLGVFNVVARNSPVIELRFIRNLRHYALFAFGLAVLGSVAALIAQAMTIAAGSSRLVAVGQTLADTRYGQIWLWRMLLMLLTFATVAFAFWGAPRRRSAWLAIGATLGIALPVPFSLLSHAAAQNEGRATAIAVDAVHLLAAMVWAGGLFMLVMVLAPSIWPLPPEERRKALQAAISRFSIIGVASWGVLLLSGVYAAWLQVGTVAALRETPYGQSLLVKLALLAPVLALAAWHLFLGRRSAILPDLARVRTTIVVEALIAVVVLLVVGRLIGLEPAREVMSSRAPSQLVVPLTFATNSGSREGTLAISPGAPGPNTFTLDFPGDPLVDGSEGVLRLGLVDGAIGQQELRLVPDGTNRFRADGSELALAGEWQIDAIVRKIGDYSWAASAAQQVSATPPRALEVNPAPLFLTSGVVAVIAVAAGVILGAIAVAGKAVRGGRAGFGAAGAVAVGAGFFLLAGARISPPDEAVMAVIAAPTPKASTPRLARSATPDAAHEHVDHEQMQMLASPGTPVAGDGISVTLLTEPVSAGATDVTVVIAAVDGQPLPDARVVVVIMMPGMGSGREETQAVPDDPGRYVAEGVPLGMAGEWHLAVRVSPKGKSTQIFTFAVEVP
jgi:copper transport protein